MVFENIVSVFCSSRGTTQESVFGADRKAEVWYTRYMLWHYLHYNANLSANQLSRMFNRNRPSIFRGIRLLKHQMKYDKNLRAEYHAIVEKIEGMAEATPSENME